MLLRYRHRLTKVRGYMGRILHPKPGIDEIQAGDGRGKEDSPSLERTCLVVKWLITCGNTARKNSRGPVH
jgi:hypothetical protein